MSSIGSGQDGGSIFDSINATARELAESIRSDSRISHVSHVALPDRQEVGDITSRLMQLLFPGFFGDDWLPDDIDNRVVRELVALCDDLSRQIAAALRYEAEMGEPDRSSPMTSGAMDRARTIASLFLRSLPQVRATLSEDVQAGFESDPAAVHTDEIIFCYPGLKALAIHRLAHELYRLNVPMIPRIMHETAHSATGIDIHPGARLGKGIFIDHGTGVVVGETTFIGDYCKIFQSVTLGALSLPTDDKGNLRRDVKRHPTLEDHVTVYANATILGGETIIGRGAIIDGGVFITESVPAGHIVRAPKFELSLATPSGASPTSYSL